MKKRSPKTQFSRLLRQEALSDQEHARLQALIRDTRRKRVMRRRSLPLALAATLFLAIGTTAYFYGAGGQPSSDARSEQATGPSGAMEEVAQRISHEVLTNHIHIKQLDRETGSLAELADHLEQLDFRIQPSRLLDGDGLRLTGGRYCTLQGAIASHLVFEAAGGYRVSHYQAAYDAERFGALPDINRSQEPLLVSERGYEVAIWQEQGLVMARAAPARTY